MKTLKTKFVLLSAIFAASLTAPVASPAAIVSFGPGSLIIPMDNGFQN
jgi:hypothetical protein